MLVKDAERTRPAGDPPDELVESLASALLWLDVAEMSLDDRQVGQTRHSLTQARLQLRAAVRSLRGPR